MLHDTAINKAMIVNKNNFYYIDITAEVDQEVLSSRPTSAYQSLPIYSDHDYYYIEFIRKIEIFESY